MAARRAKNYWEYKNQQRKRAAFRAAAKEMRWKKALLALAMCVCTLIAVLVIMPNNNGQQTPDGEVARAEDNGNPTQSLDELRNNADDVGTKDKAEDLAQEKKEQLEDAKKTSQTELQNDGKAYGRAPKKEGAAPAVALTFDDGPYRKTTPRLLDGLKEYGAKATFFVLGDRCEGNEDILKRIVSEGHELANHSYTHADLVSLDDYSIRNEVVKTNDIIKACGGKAASLRPPYGKYDSRVVAIAQYNEMRVVTWSIDTEDWRYKKNRDDAQRIVDHVLKNVKDGDIILLHDLYDTSVDAGIILAKELSNRGYQLLTVDELLSR